MRYEIVVRLAIAESTEQRKMLEKNGFATFLFNKWTQELAYVNHSGEIAFVFPDKSYHFICIYNGDKSLEDMHINRKKLEESPAFICMTEKTEKATEQGVPFIVL